MLAAVAGHYAFSRADLDALTSDDLRFYAGALGALNERINKQREAQR